MICDSDRETFSLDLEHLEHLLVKNNPHLVLAPHLFGIPHKMDQLLALKKK